MIASIRFSFFFSKLGSYPARGCDKLLSGGKKDIPISERHGAGSECHIRRKIRSNVRGKRRERKESEAIQCKSGRATRDGGRKGRGGMIRDQKEAIMIRFRDTHLISFRQTPAISVPQKFAEVKGLIDFGLSYLYSYFPFAAVDSIWNPFQQQSLEISFGEMHVTRKHKYVTPLHISTYTHPFPQRHPHIPLLFSAQLPTHTLPRCAQQGDVKERPEVRRGWRVRRERMGGEREGGEREEEEGRGRKRVESE